jgi:hypothetical protein
MAAVSSTAHPSSSTTGRSVPSHRSGYRAAVLGFGITYLAVLPFWGHEAASKAISSGYDWTNRLLAVPLVLLTVTGVLLGRATHSRWATAITAGAGAMLAGIVLEFWLGALQNAPLSDDAHRRGLPGSQVWWGSNAGFAIFGIGMLVLLVATIGAAVALRKRVPALGVAGIAAIGPLVFVAFAAKDSGTVPALVVGVLTLGAAVLAARVSD